MSKIAKCDSELSVMAECEECMSTFKLSSKDTEVQIRHKREYKINGRPIFLTYYDCPNCKKRHFVQIDDKRTLELLKKNRTLFGKLAAKTRDDKEIPKKQSDKYKKQIKYLSNYRMELMKEFTGVMLHDDETDTNIKLRFSV